MSRKINYSLLDPTGNMTILVETPVPAESQPFVAQKLMDAEPQAEQVGFVRYTDSGDSIDLRMAGGEFCGNASMCAGVMSLMQVGCEEGNIVVRVSGTADPVRVTITKDADGSRRGVVGMPKPLSVTEEVLPGGTTYPVVHFPGIFHVILEEKMDRSQAEVLAPMWCEHLKAEAIGLMFVDFENHRLAPLVYVPEAGTLVWESSCASGTTAVGAYLAKRTGDPVKMPLKQPGGTLTIAIDADGELFLEGAVRVIRQTSLEVS